MPEALETAAWQVTARTVSALRRSAAGTLAGRAPTPNNPVQEQLAQKPESRRSVLA